MLRKSLFLFSLILVFIPVTTLAQKGPEKINIPLRALIDQNDGQAMIRLYCQGDNAGMEKGLIGLKGRIIGQYAPYALVELPVKSIPEFAALESVHTIDYGLQGHRLLNDSMLINNKVTDAHAGTAPLPTPYKGDGILIGFIDTGIDFLHPDFQDSTGKSRIVSIWDQNQSTTDPSRIPKFGYGQTWDSADINAGICPHDDDLLSHGSNVAGVAVGNGLAIQRFEGVAPEADIAMVASNFNALNWLSTVADGVEYLFNLADSLNQPCVVNISAGDYLTSHDGQDPSAQRIDSMIKAKTGRVVVAAGGNAGHLKFHLGHQVGSDTTFTWFRYNPNSGLGHGAVFFRLWADTADMQNVRFAFGADKASPNFQLRGTTSFDHISNRLNQLYLDSITNSQGDVLAYVETFASQRGGSYYMDVHMPNPDSSQYYFRMMATGSGRFDVWSDTWLGTSHMVHSSLPASAQFPDIIHYARPDSLQTMVGSFTCLTSVLTVANYVNRSSYEDVTSTIQTFSVQPGARAASSSLGPTRDQRMKPDLGATGDLILSPNRLASIPLHIANNQSDRIAKGGRHKRNGGTSMAAPVVSGAAALYLEKCGTADALTIQQALVTTAVTDTFTGTTPNHQWGYGKTNVFGALVHSNYTPSILPANQNELCHGDTLILSSDSGLTQFLWSTGDTIPTLTVTDDFQGWLVTRDASGCEGRSDTIEAVFHPLPAQPQISLVPGGMQSSPAHSYQWYRNMSSIPGANDSIYLTPISGGYSVRTGNEFDCYNHSDTVDYISGIAVLVEHQPSVYPNPATDKLFIKWNEWTPEHETTLIIEDSRGRQLSTYRDFNKSNLDVSHLETGIYFLQIVSGQEVFSRRIVIVDR